MSSRDPGYKASTADALYSAVMSAEEAVQFAIDTLRAAADDLS